MVLGIILPVIFMGAMLYGSKHFSSINSYLYMIGGIWFGLLAYILAISVLLAILILVNSHYGLALPLKQIAVSLIVFTVMLVAYGIYHANNPKVVEFEVNSSSLSPMWKDKKIVIISDIHLGEIYREKFLGKVVDIINKERPDIVFNLGDIIDGPSFPYEKGFAPFSLLNPSLGNYYVEGNHETYNQEYSVFKSFFPKNINDVTGKKLLVNGTQIIGIPYGMLRQPGEIQKELDKVAYDKQVPSIILLHEPKDIQTLVNNNVSLVLSGHTHGGQFFPLTLIVKWIYGKYNHGVNYEGNTISLTTYGVGTAVTPIRIGTDSEIVVLKIK
ncbi:metallophosphoesterase [Candidatus Nomurabacteria bacterium]|nr:metallophosphoesterase [Candidatus Nomurabacteria bacterium]